MIDHRMESWRFMGAAVSRQPRHNHLLSKDPRRFGWSCQVEGCGFFKPAVEFEAVELVGGGSRVV